MKRGGVRDAHDQAVLGEEPGHRLPTALCGLDATARSRRAPTRRPPPRQLPCSPPRTRWMPGERSGPLATRACQSTPPPPARGQITEVFRAGDAPAGVVALALALQLEAEGVHEELPALRWVGHDDCHARNELNVQVAQPTPRPLRIGLRTPLGGARAAAHRKRKIGGLASDPKSTGKSALEPFSEPVRRWFEGSFAEPTPAQALRLAPHRRWRPHADLRPDGVRQDPRGLPLGDRPPGCDRRPSARRLGTGVRIVYVSPLKALSYDIERNLRAPLTGIGVDIAVGLRTGDTPQKDRQAMRRKPPDILITTPESLYLMMTSARSGDPHRRRGGDRRRDPRRRPVEARRPPGADPGAALDS